MNVAKKERWWHDSQINGFEFAIKILAEELETLSIAYMVTAQEKLHKFFVELVLKAKMLDLPGRNSVQREKGTGTSSWLTKNWKKYTVGDWIENDILISFDEKKASEKNSEEGILDRIGTTLKEAWWMYQKTKIFVSSVFHVWIVQYRWKLFIWVNF